MRIINYKWNEISSPIFIIIILKKLNINYKGVNCICIRHTSAISQIGSWSSRRTSFLSVWPPVLLGTSYEIYAIINIKTQDKKGGKKMKKQT